VTELRPDPAAADPFVSVIVPVYNHRKALALCLEALEAQTYPRDRHEIIVVDNASEDALAPVLREYPRVRVVTEATPGSYPARNRGLAVARGEVIAFTDADCVPSPDWIASGVHALRRSPDSGVIAGRIRLTFRAPARPTAIDLYSSLTSKRQHVNVERGFSETANLFTWRAVVDRVGGFDPELRARGDTIWGRRVGAAGYAIVYAEDVCVSHPAPALATFVRRVRRMVGGRYDIRRRSGIARFDTATDGATDPGQIRRVMARTGHLGRRDRVRVLGVTFLVEALIRLEWLRLRAGGQSLR